MIPRDELRQSSKLLVANGLFVVATFALHVLLARRLGVEGNADWTALWALILLVSSLFPSVVLVLARYVARFVADGGLGQARAFARRAGVAAVLGSVALGGFVFWARGTLGELLNLPSVFALALVALFLALSFLLAYVRGVLEGLQDFSRLAHNIGFEGLLRLLFGAAFLLAGWGMPGLLGGYALAAAAPIVTGTRYLARHELDLLGRTRSDRLPAGWFIEAALFVWPVLLTHLLVVAWTNVDMLLIKRLVDRHTAGLYGMLFVGGKVILFVAEALASVMIPRVAAAHRTGGDEGGPLRRTAAVLLGFCAAALAVGVAFPRPLVEFFYGPAFAPAATWLPVYLVAAVAIGLAVFAAKAHLARGEIRFVGALALGTAAVALTIWLGSAWMGLVVGALAVIGILVAVALWAPLWQLMKDEKR
jgi:stage V sporulation protein B